MMRSNRRTFLKLLGLPAMAAGFPDSIARALDIPANRRSGTIDDVEHIVILTQENRSFDHYFGTLRGVRGYGDPRAVTLPSGRSVFHQPSGPGYLLPFRPDVESLGMHFLPDPPHGWNDSHAAWNGGRYDQWVPNKGVTTMTHHTRRDIPYHYALADAFTICDAYHCSVMGPTDPNRYHMWTGWVGNDGNNGGPVITNAEVGYDWSTYPERLQRAGISWKVYQDSGVGLDAAGFWGWTGDQPYIGNYGDNSLLYFHQYQFALPGSPLAERARTGTTIVADGQNPDRLMDILREDVRRNRLPQVSWITAPEAYSEHPNWAPAFGAWYTSQIIDILTSNQDVWSKTVLFINWDEEGGFFDHIVPPTPPQSRAQGLSTVATTNEIFNGDAGHPSAPYGLGVRVPLLVVSPWSRGGWVNSQVFDHTSLIRFLEARFARHYPGLIETNITPWRRAVVGDLTTAFDFKSPNNGRRLLLPNTDSYRPENLVRFPDEVPVPPVRQALPVQEPGVRPARALPYTLHAHGAVDAARGAFQIDFENCGTATAVFQVRSGNKADVPRSYTVEPNKTLADLWKVTALGTSTYDLSVFGPNGFLRAFQGNVSGRRRSDLDVRVRYDEDRSEIALTITNLGSQAVDVRVRNNYTQRTIEERLYPRDSVTKEWSLGRMYGWYDFTVTVEDDLDFNYHIAGHLETGEDSSSDPLFGWAKQN